MNEPVDLDRVDVSEVEVGSLDSFRMTVSGVDPERVLAALDLLASHGTADLRISRRSDAGDLMLILEAATQRHRAVHPEASERDLVLRVGPVADYSGSGDPAMTSAVAAIGALAETRAELRAARIRLEQEQRGRDLTAAHLRESTQYQLGEALLEVARRPRAVVGLPARLRSIKRRRTRPSAGPSTGTFAGAPARSLRAGSVLDEFSEACLAPELHLVPLDPVGWPEQLDTVDLVLAESAWRGNGGSWDFAFTEFAERGGELRSMLDAAQRKGIRAVFWNKEDPVSFERFLPAAREFDIVLTTDADLVPEYRRECGHDRVGTLPFAAQPQLHNPIGRARGADVLARVCFAGSWRGDQYPARADDLATILGPALDRDLLDIFDRFAGDADERRTFPDPYRQAVRGRLDYVEMTHAYRRYAAFLNVNSVQSSPTMCSRRIFELLACATPVISAPSRAIDELLGDIVLVSDTPARTAELVEWAVHEPEERDRHAQLGFRRVHQAHTYGNRVDDLLSLAGFEADAPRRRVSVICVSNRPAQVDHVVDTFLSQSHTDLELVFVANTRAFTDADLASIEARVPAAKIMQRPDEITLGECLNDALAVADGDYFAKIDDDDLYGADYLTDALLTFGFSGAAVAGKQTYFAWMLGPNRTVLRFPGHEYARAPRLAGGTLVADRGQVEGIAFEALPRGTDLAFLDEVQARGLTLFSGDKYNFCQVRHADPNAHTWAIDEKEFLKGCRDVGAGLVEDRVFV